MEMCAHSLYKYDIIVHADLKIILQVIYELPRLGDTLLVARQFLNFKDTIKQ